MIKGDSDYICIMTNVYVIERCIRFRNFRVYRLEYGMNLKLLSQDLSPNEDKHQDPHGQSEEGLFLGRHNLGPPTCNYYKRHSVTMKRWLQYILVFFTFCLVQLSKTQKYSQHNHVLLRSLDNAYFANEHVKFFFRTSSILWILKLLVHHPEAGFCFRL
jgi:hypothetical protein